MENIKLPTSSINKFVHISVDDVSTILKELDEGNYESIYQHPIFYFLKNMHEQYGAVFSLYCFDQNTETPSWTLSNMTDKFKDEFMKADLWLKFGFHGRNSAVRYNELISPDDALRDYDSFIDAADKFAGIGSIDTVPRIHYFAGTREHAKKWRDARNGIKGFLSADDDREVNGYLDPEERIILEKKSYYYEENEGLHFFKTNLRLEKISDIAQTLKELADKDLDIMEQKISVIFTHEKYLYSESMQNKIENCCRWALDSQYTFAYPIELEFLKPFK